MSKWREKKLSWKKKKARLGNAPKNKKNVSGYKVTRIKQKDVAEVQTNKHEDTFEVQRRTIHKCSPENFSILDNCVQTLAFFKDIVKEIQMNHFNTKIFLDLEKVKHVTTDAIMYLLAIMGNIDNNVNQTFAGNLPKDENVKKSFWNSGFNDYVETSNIKVPSNDKESEKIKITNGDRVKTDLVKGICDFVNESCHTDKRYTSNLYEVLIELMANTVQHAYTINEIWTKHNWYIFIEDIGDQIQFYFLDIGEGIPKTMKKSFLEKLSSNVLKKDAELIMSAFEGELRSQTDLESRGKGLPCVKAYALEDEIEEFSVISGHGRCIFSHDKDWIAKKEIFDQTSRLDGTLYYWTIRKDKIKEEYLL